MNKTVVFIFGLSFLLQCCKLDKGVLPDNFLSFEIDGVFWDSLFLKANIEEKDGLRIINIEASNEDLASFYIHLVGSKGQTFYNLNDASSKITYAPSGLVFNTGNLSSNNCFPTRAEVVITSIDEKNKKISGEFEAVVCSQFGETQIAIYNGSFNNVSY